MSIPTTAQLNRTLAIGAAVLAAAEVLARITSQHCKRAPVARGGTLRPGADTPLWRALVAAIRPRLRRHGAKALLRHQLGVHRGRITEYFVKRTAMPDAERTLLLLEWLGRQRAHAAHPAGHVRITNKITQATPALPASRPRQ